jgi:hypothetical protein
MLEGSAGALQSSRLVQEGTASASRQPCLSPLPQLAGEFYFHAPTAPHFYKSNQARQGITAFLNRLSKALLLFPISQ